MKVAIINTLYAPYQVGGAERSVQILANGLLKLGVEVNIITLHEGNRVEHFILDGISIWRIPLLNIYWPFNGGHQSILKRLLWHLIDNCNYRMGRLVEDVLKQIKPDVLHTNNLAGFSVDVWNRAARLGIPVVHTARDYYLIHPNAMLFDGEGIQSEHSFTARLWSLRKKIASQRISAFVGISKYVVDIHHRIGFFRNATSHVIYNSIELVDDQSPSDGMRTNCVGYIGRLERSKGLEAVLEAMQHRPDLKLLVAGNGELSYVEHLKRIAPENVEFLGVQSPHNFFKRIDALIVPSRWAEPLGRVVLEAYSYGIPVIASKIGGLQEIVSAETGALFDVGDLDSLLLALNYVLSKNRSFYRSCLEYSLAFSEEFVASTYLDVYRRRVDEMGRR